MKTAGMIFLMICFALPGVSQSWLPYPPGQKSYYNAPTYQKVSVSGVRSEANSTVYYFLNNFGDFCPSLDLNYWNGPQAGFDSLVLIDNVIYHFTTTDTAKFYIHAPVGYEWYIPVKPTTSFNKAKVICTDIREHTFLGITDSIREFTIVTYKDTTPVNTYISEKPILISKSHGIINGPFLPLFLRNTSGLRLEIAGIHSGQASAGFKTPSFEEFFDYRTGDILVWRSGPVFNWPPFQTFLHRDSITHVIDLGDTLMMVFDRVTKMEEVNSALEYSVSYTTSSGRRKEFYKPSFDAIINATSFVPLFVSHLPLTTPPFEESTHSFIKQPIRYLSDLSVSIGLSYNGKLSSTIDGCSLTYWMDYGSYEFNSKKGLVNFSIQTHQTWEYRLVAMKTHRGTFGNHYPLSVPGRELTVPLINLYPNPAAHLLHIEVPGVDHPIHYTIYDISGTRISEGTFLHGKQLNIHDLPGGFYFLSLKNNSFSATRKFLKTNPLRSVFPPSGIKHFPQKPVSGQKQISLWTRNNLN